MTNFEDLLLISSDVIREIIEKIVYNCYDKKNVKVEKSIITFLVNILSFAPSNGYSQKEIIDPDKMINFIEYWTNKLCDEEQWSILTLKMQIYTSENPIDPENIKVKYQTLLENKTAKLTNDIMESVAKSRENISEIVKKIVVDIIMNYNLGDPTNLKVLKETKIALMSVISETDILAFAASNKTEKLRILNDLRKIVCGIRIFNKDAGHSGEGMNDLPTIIEKSYELTINLLQREMDQVTHRISLYTSVLFEHIKHSDNINSDILEPIKDITVMSRQHQVYLKNLLHLLRSIKKNILETIGAFRQELKAIHKKIQFRTAIPSDDIFPKFQTLGLLWLQLQDHIYVLSEINLVIDQYTFLTQSASAYDEIVEGLLGDKPLESDDARLYQTNSQRITLSVSVPKNQPNICEIIEANINMNFVYSGFCPVALSEGTILLRGNPNMGVISYMDNLYILSSLAAGKAFCEDPEKIIKSINEQIATKPEMIIFLDFMESMKVFREQLTHLESVSQANQHVQTELHPIPSNKNKTYFWNIWDLRKKALQLANMTNYETHAVQTTIKYDLFEVGTQTYDKKEKIIQTMASSSTNVPEYTWQN